MIKVLTSASDNVDRAAAHIGLYGPLIDDDSSGRSSEVRVVTEVTSIAANRNSRSDRQCRPCSVFQQRVPPTRISKDNRSCPA